MHSRSRPLFAGAARYLSSVALSSSWPQIGRVRHSAKPVWPPMKQTKEQILKAFGATLRAYRQQAGLSQEKLAAKAGLDRTYVGGAERGERKVALVNIVRLA